jgi:type IV secretory pathway VirB3-like protein
MKKTLGIVITAIWVTVFFYFFNMLMPKGLLYLLICVPIIFVTSLFILRKSGFKM